MRIKTVFQDSQELAHVWASQSHPEGHTRGNRIYFEGPSIFSYGSHFEIARFVESKKGSIVLFTDRDYSPTTSKHKGVVRRAVEHKKLFVVHSFNDHNENVDGYLDSIKNALESAPRSYHINEVLRGIRSTIETAKDYLIYFGQSVSKDRKAALRKFAKKSPLISDELLKKLQERESKNEERQAKSAATREVNRKKKWAEREALWAEERRKREEKEKLDRENLSADIERWKNGEEVNNQFMYNAPIALRIAGDAIETTRSANVPLIEARKFWNTLRRRENVIGMRLGYYAVDAIDRETLKVGCHSIPLREVYRMAKALQWDNGMEVVS